MAKSKIGSVLLLLFLFAGCVSTEHAMLSSKTFPPLLPEDVTIYMSEDDIPGEYEKIAIINAKGSAEMTTTSKMYDAVKKEAAKIGANGVLFSAVTEPGSGAKVAAAIFGTGTTRRAEMIAIFVHTSN